MLITLRDVLESQPVLRKNLLLTETLRDVLCDTRTPTTLNPDEQLHPWVAAVLWICGAVISKGIIGDFQMLAAVRAYKSHLHEIAGKWCDALARDSDAPLQPCLLGLANRELLSLSGVTEWYNLRTATHVVARPPVFEGISYNLAYPVKIEWLRLQEQQNAQRALQTNP
jgi:hypothetical protein